LSILECDGVSKHFGRVKALNEVSFSLLKGSVMGLIGPNGAGKTTTIKLLLGLLRPNTGQVLAFGENPWNNPRVLKRIGVVQEKPKFPLNVPTLHYLSLVAGMYGRSLETASSALRDMGLQDAFQTPIGKLSAGMIQRFALAHALIHDPEIVIADEPTSNLDPQARTEVLDLIIRTNKQRGTTFLISSHLLAELSRVCETVSIIYRGKTVATGSLNELYQNFRTDVVRVNTNKPAELAEKIKKLPYVVLVEVAGDNISIRTESRRGNVLYQDVLTLAGQIDALLNGIESKGASLEELFRKITSA